VAEAAGWVIAAVVALMILFIAGVVFAVVRPERGFQDHIAGTWLVPR
jgi:ATP/ADP translocase